MDIQTLGFALAAGSVAAVNPCGFAMLPPYLALVVIGEADEHRSRLAAVGRAQLATATMAVGFLLVFGLFGLVIAPLASSVQQFLPAVTVVIGGVLVGVGLWLLTGRELTALLPKSGKGAPTARLGSMFGYGIAYAIASLSCTIGPFLVVTTATFRGGSVVGGIAAYLAYAAGMALVVGVLATTLAIAGPGVATRARRVLPYVNRVAGVLVVLAGIYVGYYGIYELRLFHGDGDASDPVIEAAGVVQQTLAGWVDSAGVAPLLGLIAVGVLVAVLVGGRIRRRFPARR